MSHDPHSEIKKALYRENPTAFIVKEPEEYLPEGKQYKAKVSGLTDVYFFIPVKDITVRFDDEMPAKLLIRWIQKYTNAI